eukprot:s442_g9.t1
MKRGTGRKGSVFPLSEGDFSEALRFLRSVALEETFSEAFTALWSHTAWKMLACYACQTLDTGHVPFSRGSWNKAQKRMVSAVDQSVCRLESLGHAEVSDVSAVEKELKSKRVSYEGEELGVCHKLSYNQVLPALPPKEHGGSIDVLEFVPETTKEMLLNPEKLVVLDVGQELPKLQGRVHVESGEMDKIAAELVMRGVCHWIPYSSVFEFRGQKILNGLFGVEKSGFEQGEVLHQEAEALWKRAGVVSAEKKRKRCEVSGQELGAFVHGGARVMGPSPERLVKLIQATLVVLQRKSLSRKLVQVICGRWVHVFQFRRPAMSLLEACWEYISAWGTRYDLQVKVRRELFACLSAVPLLHTFLGGKIGNVTTASDASHKGGAVGIAKQLSPAGEDFVRSSLIEGQPRKSGIMVLSLFHGIGGSFRAYDILGIRPDALVAFDIHKPAMRVTSRRWPQTEMFGDVKDLNEALLEKLLMKYPEITEIHLWGLWGGFPCIDLSSVNVLGRGLAGPQSSLFFEFVRVLRLLKKKSPRHVKIKYVAENVASMPKSECTKISDELRTRPYHLNCADAVPMQRPRLCWTSEELDGCLQGLEFSEREYWTEIRAEADYPSQEQWITPGTWWPGEFEGHDTGVISLKETKTGLRNAAHETVSITNILALEVLRAAIEEHTESGMSKVPLWLRFNLGPSCTMLGPTWGAVGTKRAPYWPQVEAMLRTLGVETVKVDDAGPICKLSKFPQVRALLGGLSAPNLHQLNRLSIRCINSETIMPRHLRCRRIFAYISGLDLGHAPVFTPTQIIMSAAADLFLGSRRTMGNSVPSKLVADVVPVNSETTFFPGAHNAYNAKFCLCTSGGGARAMTHTMGVYRALYEMGILEEVDGISSVSGGTWASSIYMFGKDFEGKAIDTATMLGPRSDPQQLTMEVLRQEAPPLARGLTKGNSSDLVKKHAGTRRDNEVWARVVADMLLEPFGLASFDCAVAKSEEDVERIKEENPEIKTWSFKTPRTDRPKLFVMNGALLAPDDHSITEDNVVSFQMSPDYTGSPFYPKDEVLQFPADVTYPPAPLCCIYPCWRSALTLSVGGGFIESFAFGGKAPAAAAQRGGSQVSVPAPASIFSLPEMVGISSYAPASAFSNRRITDTWLNIRKLYWPITSDSVPTAQEAHQYALGDGGAIDNSGLLPLLQRRARKVIWIATSYMPMTEYDYEKATFGSFDPYEAQVVDQLSAAFGYGRNDKDEGYFYSNNQVFKGT